MLLVTNRRPVVHLPLAHERGVEAREVADRFFVREVPQALGERREARLAADEDGRPDHLAQIEIGGLLGRQRADRSDGVPPAIAMLKAMPVARRVRGESDEIAIKMRWNYAESLYKDPSSTLDDLREAVTTLEDAERFGRRVLGVTHPLTMDIGRNLRESRAALRARETPWAGSA